MTANRIDASSPSPPSAEEGGQSVRAVPRSEASDSSIAARSATSRTSWQGKIKDKMLDLQEALLLQVEETRTTFAPSTSVPSRSSIHDESAAAARSEASVGLHIPRRSGSCGHLVASNYAEVPRSNGSGSPGAGLAGGISRTSTHAANSPGGWSDSPKSVTARVEMLTPQMVTRRISRRSATLDRSPGTRRARIIHRLRTKFQSGFTYMGMDWYTVYHKRHRPSLLFLVENLYFWAYATYIVTVILLGGSCLWIFEPERSFTFLQAVYTAAACVSQSGLAVVDWSDQAVSTYIISFILIILGSAPLLHLVPIVLRQINFWMQANLMTAAGPLAEPARGVDLPSEEDVVMAPRRACSDPCMGPSAGLDSPAASPPSHQLISLGKRGGQLVDPATYLGKGHCAKILDAKHRLEYVALRKIFKILLSYIVVSQLIGTLVFGLYFRVLDQRQWQFRRTGPHGHLWHALYLSVSSFQNNGLTMSRDSLMHFSHSPTVLGTTACLILLGNTCLPIMIRLIVYIMSRQAQPNSESKRVLDFLLEHPRRCFTHMFPAVHTLWLLLVVVVLNLVTTLVILWQDWSSAAFESADLTTSFFKVLNAAFQAVSCRTAGLNSVNLALLSQASTFFIVVMMYFSTTPTVVTMRFSAVAGGQELDITGRAEGHEIGFQEDSIKDQARRYLTQDVTYLTVILFLICCFEAEKFGNHELPKTCGLKPSSYALTSTVAPTPSADSRQEGIYGDFSFFKVVFEMASAYGTCGFSLGYANQACSFSEAWSPTSQFLLVVVMILGRLRGLPDSIDPSVRVTMQHRADGEKAFLHL